MCGIAGFILREGARADPEPLRRMARALAHRGPDDRGIHCAGPVGLTQTRLSIIGLESGHQPMRAADGSLALVANGEVYNYLELNAGLRARGRVFATDSDSETILHTYALDGLEGLAALRGMYAFALHDVPAGRLILGRDRLGIKPLFYTRLADRVAFASELKALLAILPWTPTIRAAGLRQFLQHQFAGGERTVLESIRRLPPGELMVVDTNLTCTRRRYWSALDAPPRPLDVAAALAELETLLDDSMREHLRADVPFGLFLSGGLDSSVLAALLHRHGAGRIQSFSVGYARGDSGAASGGLDDELADAARIAEHFGFAHQALTLDLPRVLGRLPRAIWAADELMRDYAALPTTLLAETAAAAGLKVVFSGEGGDEVFAGYRRYRPGWPERWLKALRWPGSGGFRTRGQWSPAWSRRLHGPALRAVETADREAFAAAWQATPPAWSELQRRQYTDLVTALPDNLLVKTDRMLMAFGVEGRVPFLDHRLVEFGLALPDRLKVRGRQGKWLLRLWAQSRLPPGSLRRPKRGFHVPIGLWLRGATAARVGERLCRNPGVREWFDLRAVADLAATVASSRGASRSGTRELFSLMQFAIWHRLFIDQPGQCPDADDDPLEWIASR